MAPSKAGVAMRPVPEKSSRITEIGAMPGAAIHPRLRNRTHHRLGKKAGFNVPRAGCARKVQWEHTQGNRARPSSRASPGWTAREAVPTCLPEKIRAALEPPLD